MPSWSTATVSSNQFAPLLWSSGKFYFSYCCCRFPADQEQDKQTTERGRAGGKLPNHSQTALPLPMGHRFGARTINEAGGISNTPGSFLKVFFQLKFK